MNLWIAALFIPPFLCIGAAAQEQTPPPPLEPAANVPGSAAAPASGQQAPQQAQGAAVIPNGPTAQIVTSMGTITLTLDAEHAPAAVKNFLRYAREGHFNGTVVYRVVPRFVIQMGSIDARGKGRPLHKPIPLETANGQKNVRGAVAMARSDAPESATAEFFIDLSDNTPLDPRPGDAPNTTGYAVFAHVTGGMDVVDAIAAVPLSGGYGPFKDAAPQTPLVIKAVKVPPAAPEKKTKRRE